MKFYVIERLVLLLIHFQLLITGKGPNFEKINGHLRVATYNNPLAGIPGVPASNRGLMECDLLDRMSKELNFTYDIVRPNDINQIGLLTPSGSWTGVFGLLKTNEADISISFGPRGSKRAVDFDLTASVVTDSIGIMIPYPNIGIKSSGFTTIFSSGTWYTTFLSTLTMVSTVWYIGKRFKPLDKIEYGSLCLYIFGVILGQGGWIRNKSFAYRLTFGSWLVSITVVVYGYQSTLLSRLSVPDINYLATSLDDIAKDQTIMTFALKDSATYVEFQESQLPQFKSVSKRFETHPDLLLTDVTDSVEKVSNRIRSLLIASDIVIDEEIQRDYRKTGKCRATMLKNKIMVRRNGLYLRKRSRWTRAFNDEMLLLRQHGFGKHVEEKYGMYARSRCNLNEQEVKAREYNGPLTLHQTKNVFVVLASGCFLASVAFLCEQPPCRRSRERPRKRKQIIYK